MKANFNSWFVMVVVATVALGPGIFSYAQQKTEPHEQVTTPGESLKASASGDVFTVRVFPENDEGLGAVLQGRAFLVRVEDPDHIIASVRARWEGQEIPCLPGVDRNQWYGFGGVVRYELSGQYDLDVSIETTMGERIETRKSLNVQRADFSKDELTVAPSMVQVPPDKQAWVEEDRRAFAAAYADPVYGKLWDGPFLRPVQGRVTAEFGEHRVFNKEVQSVHGGVDLAGPEGTPVQSAASGKVVMARSCYIAGNTVIVDHGSGLFTYYCHLSEFKVEPGMMIDQGDVVGLIGMTGRVTGPHLHWGCRAQGVKVDALSLLSLSQWMSDD